MRARYAKRQMAVRCLSDGSGFKTRAMRLCVALKGRWSNREGVYIISVTKAARLERLHAEGYDATSMSGQLIAPDEVWPGVKRDTDMLSEPDRSQPPGTDGTMIFN